MVVTNDEESLLLSPDDSPKTQTQRRRSNVHTIRPTLHSLREEPRLVSLGSFREDSKRKGSHGVCYGSVNGRRNIQTKHAGKWADWTGQRISKDLPMIWGGGDCHYSIGIGTM